MVSTLISSMPMFVCGILSALLGLNLYQKWNKPKFLLLLFMITATLLYFCHYFFFKQFIAYIPVTDTIYSFCNPAVYPLYYIYIQVLTRHDYEDKRLAIFLIPAVICSFTVGTLYLFMSENDTQQFITLHLYGNELMTLTGMQFWQGLAHVMVKVVFAIEVALVGIFGWKDINKYDEMVDNYFSNTEDKKLSNIKLMLVFFILASIASFIFNIIGRFRFCDSSWMLSIPSIIFSLLLLLIGHIGLLQEFYVKDIVLETPEIEKEEQSVKLPTNLLKDKIKKLMDEQHLFLHQNLKIGDLAKELNSNRNYIYNAINVEMGMSFSEYINQKRIEYAIKLMESEPNLNLADIANKSGFASTSAFYRNFKLYKGCSPSEYQRKR